MKTVDHTKCWVPIPIGSDFSIHNIPFGIFSTLSKSKRVGVAVGEQILDLSAVAEMGLFSELAINNKVFNVSYLNDFIALGKKLTSAVRLAIQRELTNPDSPLKTANVFEFIANAELHLPVSIGDYTDFYSSVEHATNVGKMFRDPENALLPNWRHLPVGYHGRASSIVVSGTPVYRPQGQLMPKGADTPIFGQTQCLDFELEMAYVIGKENPQGIPISVEVAEDYIFGKVIFNDWSARDIQKWEYVPLGPFLSKSFASSISPWVVTMDALDYFRVQGPKQKPKVLPYLQQQGKRNFDIHLEVTLQPRDEMAISVSKSNFKYMYWSMAQQLAHHTVNGCNLRIGDVMASGTISGPTRDSMGSMLELTWSGKNPVMLDCGKSRYFIEDYDTVTLRAHCEKDGIRIGFGEVATQILPTMTNAYK